MDISVILVRACLSKADCNRELRHEIDEYQLRERELRRELSDLQLLQDQTETGSVLCRSHSKVRCQLYLSSWTDQNMFV